MIVHEPGAPGRARVIGSVSGDAIRILLDAMDGGVSVLGWLELWLRRVPDGHSAPR
jgi:hypothetical protein